jgi:hypothetical protein
MIGFHRFLQPGDVRFYEVFCPTFADIFPSQRLGFIRFFHHSGLPNKARKPVKKKSTLDVRS